MIEPSQITSELSWTLDALKGDYGWALCYTTWRAALSFSFGFINDKIQAYVESLIPEDQKFLTIAGERGFISFLCFWGGTGTSSRRP